MEKQEDRKMGKITDIIFNVLKNLVALFFCSCNHGTRLLGLGSNGECSVSYRSIFKRV